MYSTLLYGYVGYLKVNDTGLWATPARGKIHKILRGEHKFTQFTIINVGLMRGNFYRSYA